jgi:hypothetical protein
LGGFNIFAIKNAGGVAVREHPHSHEVLVWPKRIFADTLSAWVGMRTSPEAERSGAAGTSNVWSLHALILGCGRMHP